MLDITSAAFALPAVLEHQARALDVGPHRLVELRQIRRASTRGCST